MAKKSSKSVVEVKKETKAMVQFDESKLGGNTGFEEAGADSYALPFLRVLQKLSPQVDEDNEGAIEGADAGMLYNGATGQLYDGEKNGAVVLPVHFRRTFIEWIPRKQGGGFVADHGPEKGLVLFDSSTRTESRNVLDNGHEIVDTRIHYVLVGEAMDDDSMPDIKTFTPAILSAQITQIKGSKDWMTLMKQKVLPSGKPAAMHSQLWRLLTKKRKKDENTWSVFRATSIGFVFDHYDQWEQLVKMANSFREVIISGKAKIDHGKMQDEQEDSDSDSM